MNGEVMIATPAYGGQVYTGYVSSLISTLDLLRQADIPYFTYMIGNESLISRARNECASVARDRGAKKLMFIDADQSWDPRQFYRLYVSKLPVVGGGYPKKTFPIDYAFNPLDEDRKYFNGPKNIDDIRSWAAQSPNNIGKGIMRVRHIATGFLMIDMDVFDQMIEKIPERVPEYATFASRCGGRDRDFFPVKVTNDRLMGEDWAFCDNCREIGVDVHLDTMCLCHHTGTFTWRSNHA